MNYILKGEFFVVVVFVAVEVQYLSFDVIFKASNERGHKIAWELRNF